jgi:polyferredoxin
MLGFDQPSLVQYTTAAAVEGRKARKVRPRTLVYGGLLVVIAVAFVSLLEGRHPTQAFVGRAPGTLFQIDPDGWVRNTYLVRITNNRVAAGSKGDVFALTVDGIDRTEVLTVPVTVPVHETATVPLVVRVRPEAGLPSTVPLTIHVTSAFDDVSVEATFKAPRGST